VLLITFDDRLGPIIELSLPELRVLPMEWKYLPFAALPDGVHNQLTDYVIFHLPPLPAVTPITCAINQGDKAKVTFAFGCIKQLHNKSNSALARNTKQKSLVILSTNPNYSLFKSLLDDIDYFSSDYELDIKHLFNSLTTTTPVNSNLNQNYCLTNSLIPFIVKFKHKTLLIVKLLLLQRKILFFGSNTREVCSWQYSLLSLFPLLLNHLDLLLVSGLDNEDVGLENDLDGMKGDLRNLESDVALGLPLNFFTTTLFQPYTTVQQLDSLRNSSSFLAGATNQIFTTQTKQDAIIYTDSGTIDYSNNLEPYITLTPPDWKFMDSILSTIENDSVKGRDTSETEDEIRRNFRLYLLGFLSCVHECQQVDPQDLNLQKKWVSDYGILFVSEWIKTPIFENWSPKNRLVSMHHPNQGTTKLSEWSTRVGETIKSLKVPDGVKNILDQEDFDNVQKMAGMATSTASRLFSSFSSFVKRE
jgi:hypothetical protein